VTDLREESVAFQQAVLKSARLRMRIILGAIGVAFLLRTIRTAVLEGQQHLSLRLISGGLLILFVSYELVMLHAVCCAIQQARRLANWIWLKMLSSRLRFRVLHSPLYRVHPSIQSTDPWRILFIGLSTLRLDPTLCRLSGLTAAIRSRSSVTEFRDSVGPQKKRS